MKIPGIMCGEEVSTAWSQKGTCKAGHASLLFYQFSHYKPYNLYQYLSGLFHMPLVSVATQTPKYSSGSFSQSLILRSGWPRTHLQGSGRDKKHEEPRTCSVPCVCNVRAKHSRPTTSHEPFVGGLWSSTAYNKGDNNVKPTDSHAAPTTPRGCKSVRLSCYGFGASKRCVELCLSFQAMYCTGNPTQWYMFFS